MPPKNIVIFGSTGSIGTQTVDIIKSQPLKYKAVALTAGCNVVEIFKQIKVLKPKMVYMSNEKAGLKLNKQLAALKASSAQAVKLIKDNFGLSEQTDLIRSLSPDLTVNAVSGMAGVTSTLASLSANVNVALANKESIVIAFELIENLLKKSTAMIIPVDSEPNAIFQCLAGENIGDVRNLWITASGGPFRGMKALQLKQVTVKQALAHPRWNMGPKITIDSSTLMNKGLEVIEAAKLFGLPPEKIKVVVHPQSIIHSMVEFNDGTFKAVLSETDMRFAIAYGLSYPERGEAPAKVLDLNTWSQLTFEEPDNKNFPALDLAFEALAAGGSFPAAYCIANELAVAEFVEEKLSFLNITRVVAKVLAIHKPRRICNMDGLDELIMDVETATRKVLSSISTY